MKLELGGPGRSRNGEKNGRTTHMIPLATTYEAIPARTSRGEVMLNELKRDMTDGYCTRLVSFLLLYAAYDIALDFSGQGRLRLTHQADERGSHN